MIHCENVIFDYASPMPGGEPVRVLDGLSLHVRSGERVAVIGPNGAGKTTLLLLLAGIAPCMTSGRLRGKVAVKGRVGMVFQEVEGQHFNATVADEVAWGLENLGVPVPEMRARIDAVLKQIGLWELRERAPHALSGGEQKRLALAAALAMRPDVLLLDEPAGGLDPCGRAEVLAALDTLNGTIVMAESDPEIAARADRVLVLHEGRFQLEGTPDEVFREVGKLDSIGAPVPPAARLAAQIGADFVTREGALAALRKGAA